MSYQICKLINDNVYKCYDYNFNCKEINNNLYCDFMNKDIFDEFIIVISIITFYVFYCTCYNCCCYSDFDNYEYLRDSNYRTIFRDKRKADRYY